MINKIRKEKEIFMGAGAIMLAALLWSLDGVFIRPKFYEFPAGLIVFLEHFLGFIFLSPFIYLGWHRIKYLKTKDWLAIFWVCVFGGLIGTLMITKAFFAAVFGEVTFATVVILQKLQPVFALLIARIVLKEKLKPKFYFWASLAILAAYFLAFGKTGLNFSEIDFSSNAAVFAVIAAFAFGSSTVFGKRVVNHLDFQSATALRFGITGFLALVYILITGDLFEISSLAPTNWGYLFLIVFSSGAAALFIYYYGLKKVTASTATICELFWPFSAVILDYFINRNALNSFQIVAGLVLLLAFYKVVTEGRQKKISFTAQPVAGFGRGTKLGFPTLNLDRVDLDIDHGIYLVKTNIGNQEIFGLMHFGNRETFSEEPSLELFIKEKVEDSTEKDVDVEIVKRIRDIIKFAKTEDLIQQIKEDIENHL